MINNIDKLLIVISNGLIIIQLVESGRQKHFKSLDWLVRTAAVYSMDITTEDHNIGDDDCSDIYEGDVSIKPSKLPKTNIWDISDDNELSNQVSKMINLHNGH